MGFTNSHAFGSLADGVSKMRPEGRAHASWVSGGKWGEPTVG